MGACGSSKPISKNSNDQSRHIELQGQQQDNILDLIPPEEEQQRQSEIQNYNENSKIVDNPSIANENNQEQKNEILMTPKQNNEEIELPQEEIIFDIQDESINQPTETLNFFNKILMQQRNESDCKVLKRRAIFDEKENNPQC